MPAKMPRGLCANKEGAAPKFDPVEADWQRMATAWHVELSADDRDTLKAIVDRYLDYEWIEQEAPPVSEIERRARSIQNAARALYRALSGNDASFDGIENRLDGRLLAIGQPALRGFHIPLCALIAECGAEISDQRKKSGGNGSVREGAAWGQMIRDLAQFARAHDFRFGVASDGSSWFVAFVRALQEAVPVEYRQHLHSNEALGKAMQEALHALPNRP